ncbi:hypothetical protein OPV22_015650 [Ensete ventricosum]|uniref:Uncharacterized protein n=1 Tax=Ensete ventricosum TaxID=4639 RepID=A0AAV8PM34_ENSVE|nr:hypothetical protein OPV22_015650 [Ensete ventricosum]
MKTRTVVGSRTPLSRSKSRPLGSLWLNYEISPAKTPGFTSRPASAVPKTTRRRAGISCSVRNRLRIRCGHRRRSASKDLRGPAGLPVKNAEAVSAGSRKVDGPVMERWPLDPP